MTQRAVNFECYAIVEIFGHERIAGHLSEQSIGGCSFIRVDVPEVDGQPAFTRMFGQAAIYSITPVSEGIARSAAASMRVKPVSIYLLPSPALKSSPGDEGKTAKAEASDGDTWGADDLESDDWVKADLEDDDWTEWDT